MKPGAHTTLFSVYVCSALVLCKKFLSLLKLYSDVDWKLSLSVVVSIKSSNIVEELCFF